MSCVPRQLIKKGGARGENVYLHAWHQVDDPPHIMASKEPDMTAATPKILRVIHEAALSVSSPWTGPTSTRLSLAFKAHSVISYDAALNKLHELAGLPSLPNGRIHHHNRKLNEICT